MAAVELVFRPYTVHSKINVQYTTVRRLPRGALQRVDCRGQSVQHGVGTRVLPLLA